MPKLAILHFSPIELYPPALNWIHFLAERLPADWEVDLYTMHPPAAYPAFASPSPRIRIRRYGSTDSVRGVVRYLGYALFHLRTLFSLAVRRPDRVLYFETLSALPALVYKRWLRRNSRLYIHYHEYTTPAEYRQGMRLALLQHRMERKCYPAAEWISHTNEDRNRFFKADLEGIAAPPLQLLPNYPPAHWLKGSGLREGPGRPLKLVHVGALSLHTMYTRELASWVSSQRGDVTWDIYTGNATGEAVDFLRSCDPALIRLHAAVNYYSLPEVLARYDVGVITYNGSFPNHTYSAPNKLFEYWACGLDVWLSDKLTSSLPFINRGVFPKIIGLDFADLSGFDWRQAVRREGLEAQPSSYSAETVLDVLWKKMQEKPSIRV